MLGSGPGDLDAVSLGTLRELQSLDVLIVRTMRHPSMPSLVEKAIEAGVYVVSCDPLYELHSDFGILYREIARLIETFVTEVSRRVLVLSAFENVAGHLPDLLKLEKIGYLTPGSPMVLERTVELLLSRFGEQIRLVPALSFADVAFSVLKLDPFEKSLRLMDANELISSSNHIQGNVLVSQVWNTGLAYQVFDALISNDHVPRVAYLYHLGLSDQIVRDIEISDLIELEFDHLTSLYIEGFQGSTIAVFSELINVVARLRRECPWDQKQTHSTLGKHLIEESYEVLEAITQYQAALTDVESGDSAQEQIDGTLQQLGDEVAGELGDLLVQVLFHSEIASESGIFDLFFVVNGIKEKLIRRHPHVFEGLVVEGIGEVLSNWEEIKRQEKVITEPAQGVPIDLPALLYGAKIVRKADAFGYRTPSRSELLNEIDSIVASLKISPNLLGSLIFTAVKLSKLDSIDLEAELKAIARAFSATYADDTK